MCWAVFTIPGELSRSCAQRFKAECKALAGSCSRRVEPATLSHHPRSHVSVTITHSESFIVYLYFIHYYVNVEVLQLFKMESSGPVLIINNEWWLLAKHREIQMKDTKKLWADSWRGVRHPICISLRLMCPSPPPTSFTLAVIYNYACDHLLPTPRRLGFCMHLFFCQSASK